MSKTLKELDGNKKKPQKKTTTKKSEAAGFLGGEIYQIETSEDLKPYEKEALLKKILRNRRIEKK
ncbi:MAG: hypothetical protein FK734_11860 [Asgard group archaeon]|nr:hypothetical protein [Asgard group archaeon]